MPSSTSLKKKIEEITANAADEADLYAYIRDLLTRKSFGIDLGVAQVVIDTSFDESRRRPDIAVYRTAGGKALRGPDYVHAVFEVKTGSQVKSELKSLVRQKRGYVQPGTQWFFLLDQTVVSRVDVRNREAFQSAMSAHKPLPAELAPTWSWEELGDPEAFADCFGPLSREELTLERELDLFKAGKTEYAYLEAAGDGRALFAETVKEASEQIRSAVRAVIETRGVADLRAANLALAPMILDYGEARFDWANPNRIIDFERILNPKQAAMLSEELILSYETRLDDLMDEVAPYIYALRLETDLLQQYAARQGLENASLLKLESKEDKPNRRLLQSLVYETGSLILSRMLMIRFSEDYELFERRYISNGGVEVFWNYARHFDRPMQALLRETYRLSRSVFRSIFDPTLLDWAIERDDPVLSAALTRAAYVLSRWNFKTVKGDILSGVYDRYLDVSQRRRLGEVYTRPEVARFMLAAADWKPSDRILDPACGTGTFLVEALSDRLQELSKAGAVNDDNVKRVLEGLHGLDISTFSIALAQIQVFWHLMELMVSKTAEDAQKFARAILPVLRLYGGWSSLDTMGRGFTADDDDDGPVQGGLAFRVSHARTEQDRARALVPTGFERTVNGQYDLVIMNPPYIRSERQGSANYRTSYGEVAFRGTDTSIYFVYRALKHWVKPGGRLAFIVPIGLLEAEYAGPLRRLMAKYRIKLIADLEGLGKATFRGVKRATVIVIVEKVPASPDDDVELLQLDPTAVVEDALDDVIDFGKARRSILKRHQLDRQAYLPAKFRHATTSASAAETADRPAWLKAIRVNEGGADAILSKLADADIAPLQAMSELPRLGEIVAVVWVKRTDSKNAEVLAKPPSTGQFDYHPELLFNYGVKLGGQHALEPAQTDETLTLYKGQNIFPQGLQGQPFGYWSRTLGKEDTQYIYSYSDHLTYQNTYGLRELSQLPTAAKIHTGQGFQNTGYVIELTEEFPLHSYLLSRVVQFYCARILRSSIIEDLGCHWYKRTIPFLPIPIARTAADLEKLRIAGEAVVNADSDVANKFRHIDDLKKAGAADNRSLGALIVHGNPVVKGIDLTQIPEVGIAVGALSVEGEELVSADGGFKLSAPDNTLLHFIAYELTRMIEDDPDVRLARSDVLDLQVPTNLEQVVAAIGVSNAADPGKVFAAALDSLDQLVADQCGISDQNRDYMVAQMREDPILANMRPMLAQRGLRVQSYSDRSGEDRYD